MKNIVVVGVGGLGSHAVMLLRNVEVTIKVIDFDRVSSKNVMSQFHSKPSVGKPKVMSLAQSMSFLFGLKIETVPHKLTGDNAKELLGGASLVVDALDNGASRRVVQGFVRRNLIPCVHGALAADGGFGRVAWDEGFKIDDEDVAGAPTCEDGEHLSFVALTASYIARAAQEFLATGKKLGFQISPTGSVVCV